MDWTLPYPSRREPVLADAMVATSQPLAVHAGLGALGDGGNAVDAALAAAITLTVVEPTSNGIGGDLFAIVWDGAALHGLNASGRSPAALDVDRLLATESMPLRGWDTVTVPGAVSGWVALAERFGTLGLERLVAPAARYARDGFPVGPVTAAAWAGAADTFADHEDFAPFLVGGRAPAAGQRFALPAQARTLAEIARTRGASFYRGDLAERIVAHAASAGAALSREDLERHEVEWVTPMQQRVGDVTVHELPPNGQGVVALEALAILDRLGIAEHAPDSPAALHLQIEATKAAFADAAAHVADPGWMALTPADLLEPGFIAGRSAAVDPDRALDPPGGQPQRGGTVYLCAADADGMAVSLIQSNFHGFGSGVVVPDTGIALHNRGAGFVTRQGHPNAVAGAKRPFHTIIPGFAGAADGTPSMAFGVMGGHMQPQGHVQVVLRAAVWGQNPQAALDAPRWRVETGRVVAVEPGVAEPTVRALRQLGHELVTDTAMGGFGGGQIVARGAGSWIGASDPRKEGQAAGF